MNVRSKARLPFPNHGHSMRATPFVKGSPEPGLSWWNKPGADALICNVTSALELLPLLEKAEYGRMESAM